MVVLTADNFEKEVLKSKDSWLVEVGAVAAGSGGGCWVAAGGRRPTERWVQGKGVGGCWLLHGVGTERAMPAAPLAVLRSILWLV